MIDKLPLEIKFIKLAFEIFGNSLKKLDEFPDLIIL